MITHAAHQLDFYKVSHPDQYPEGTEFVYSNLTPRSGNHSNVSGSQGIIWIGMQLFIKEFLIDEWRDTFFKQNKYEAIERYKRRLSTALGYEISTERLERLHDLGYLPVKIKALPEGSLVPYGVPVLTIVNTLKEFYWVTNMLETVLSSDLWLMSTSATTYFKYRTTFERFAERTCDDKSFVPFQGHDFSFRGMSCREAAARSGFAVLAAGSFGTDTIPGIDVAIDYYQAKDDEFIAGSVPATEHSVMCSGTQEGELEFIRHLITEVYPTGIISIVCDTWDFWKVVTEYLPALKEDILARDGKVVIRPDSGDPVDIICGYNAKYVDDRMRRGKPEHEVKGLIECLWDIFGGRINSRGYKELNPKIGAIYGDSITLDRQTDILFLLEDKGFASNNIVLGIGSYTYQMVTRDTHGFAMKATNVVINGESRPIFKDPKTDNGTKKSAKGLLMVIDKCGHYELKDNCTTKEEKHGALETVFIDGQLVKEVTFQEVRDRVNSYVR